LLFITAIKSEKYKKIGLKSTDLSAILWVSFILKHPVYYFFIINRMLRGPWIEGP